MANVLNSEPESITLNTELELPTLEPATELEQPSFESTSNFDNAEAVEASPMDADTPYQPEAQAMAATLPAPPEFEPAAAPEENAPEAGPPVEVRTRQPATQPGGPNARPTAARGGDMFRLPASSRMG